MTHRRLAALLILLLCPTTGGAQHATGDASDPIGAIDAEFAEKFRGLERERLSRLAELAGTSEGPQAVRAYETYFRSALGAGLYQEAEPVAQQLLSDGAPSPVVRYLAEVANVMAEADRGDFEQSFQSIITAAQAGRDANDDEAALARQALPASARLSLLDTYYQRLVQAGQYEIARKAFDTIKRNAHEGGEPSVVEYLDHRIRQLDMIGRPAPSFEGHDVDGRLVRLGDYAGKPVLLVFWATWHRPNVEQVAWMKEAIGPYRDKGLQIIGVNLDSMSEANRPIAEVAPEVRRYVLEYNIPWPNIINTRGDGDISDAYGVTEIPANVLIGRDGLISALDLSQSTFAREVDKAMGAGAE
ncbi:peroxiredoxin family protein [Tautonia plasticadhaerens]|uniref:Thiol-disulfide oxidoreductase ResA n=1 Tax=Tautonia plasticadhaerens TaxID=2527974 RepID=A0A518GZG0_9BACT|nr:TlpA disulfide reductase family protein [Tautonia plasticadhaerens]QDV33969.1 Thiol-disulfide oxidoreductase ResA [Tautonia plasticadhaerens]